MEYISNLVKTIHTTNSSPSGKKFVISTTGGAYSSTYYLMSQPGASNTILELNGPYLQEATLDLLNRDSHTKTTLDQFASLDAAQEMADASLKRTQKLLTMQCSTIDQLECLEKGIGIGVACALASSCWKRGEHRCHVVIANGTQRINFSLTLEKGEESKPFRTRPQEDELCGALVVCAVAVASGQMELAQIKDNLMTNCGLSELDKFDVSINTIVSTPLEQLITKQVSNVLCINGTMIPDVPLSLLGEYKKTKPKIIMLPGSFNPLHSGHKSALKSSISLLDSSVGIYEMCISNVDKPTMEKDEVLRRLKQFDAIPVILTNAPRFKDKATLFPGISFAIGIDTAVRLIDPKYTNGDEKLMIEALKGTQFFVDSRTFGVAGIPASFPLKLDSNELLSLSRIMKFIPEVLRPFFIELPKSEFTDVSSSQLRKKIE